jgi:hypothetical protein
LQILIVRSGDMQKTMTLSRDELARLGGGVLGYVREIAAQDAKVMLGAGQTVPPSSKLFCLYNADGTPVSISGTREAALGSAFEHELLPASVH